MKLKKTVVSLAGLALLSVGTLALSSNSASAAENDDSTTVTFNVKKGVANSSGLFDEKWTPHLAYEMGPDGTGSGYTNYHVTSDGPGLWKPSFYWWRHH